jgi:prevent-host-death family protein
MTEQMIGIEEARKTLGDLVAGVRHTGRPVTLTKNGKPAARIVPYVQASEYDVIRVAGDNADYEPDEVGKLAVQRNGEFLTFVDDLDAAVTAIAREVCAGVALVRAGNYFGGERWTVA